MEIKEQIKQAYKDLAKAARAFEKARKERDRLEYRIYKLETKRDEGKG